MIVVTDSDLDSQPAGQTRGSGRLGNESGQPASSSVEARRRRGLRVLGRLPRLPPHVRHAAVRRGQECRAGAALLGHHSPPFTLSVYVHLLDGDIGEPLQLPSSAQGRSTPPRRRSSPENYSASARSESAPNLRKRASADRRPARSQIVRSATRRPPSGWSTARKGACTALG